MYVAILLRSISQLNVIELWVDLQVYMFASFCKLLLDLQALLIMIVTMIINSEQYYPNLTVSMANNNQVGTGLGYQIQNQRHQYTFKVQVYTCLFRSIVAVLTNLFSNSCSTLQIICSTLVDNSCGRQCIHLCSRGKGEEMWVGGKNANAQAEALRRKS